MKRSFGGAIKVATGMVGRKRKRYDEGDGGEEADGERGNREERVLTRRMSAGRMSTRSDMVVVQPSPPRRRKTASNGRDVHDRIIVKEGEKPGRNTQSNGVRTPSMTLPVEREKPVTLDLSNIKTITKGPGENTPIKSPNGSTSETSIVMKPIHEKTLRSRGISCKSCRSN